MQDEGRHFSSVGENGGDFSHTMQTITITVNVIVIGKILIEVKFEKKTSAGKTPENPQT